MKRGTGTAIIEIKLSRDLAGVDQEPLLLVLLDLITVYDILDDVRLLNTLEGYGAGPKIRGVI